MNASTLSPISFSPLSIIIVNYHSSDLIVQCLRSVYQFNDVSLFEIIIIDNSSDLAGKTTITSQFPLVKWIDMGYNAGFARANNAGMKAAKGDTFLLLNPDTLAVDNSIERCYQRLKRCGYIAAGVQLLDEGGQPQISGSFFVKGGLNHLLPIPYWGGFIRWLGYKAKSKVPGIQVAKSIEEVDWISGAFLMVKRSVVEQAGMMDEDFFLYGEEVEWCSRLKNAGKLCLFGDLKIIHLEGASINKSQDVQEKGYYNLYDKKGLQLMVSNHLRVRKQYGTGWFLFLLLNYTWGTFFYFLSSTLHRLFSLRNPLGEWKRVGAFAGNVLHVWKLSPTIIRNQPHFYKMF
jgi:GT2 family glycosyltransferase